MRGETGSASRDAESAEESGERERESTESGDDDGEMDALLAIAKSTVRRRSEGG